MWKIPQKGTSLRESASFEPSCVKIRWRVWPVGEFLKRGINKNNFGYTSWLRQRNTRRASCVAAPPPNSVGAQRRRQTYTSFFSVWAHHTDAARPSLAAVSGTRRFQAGCARLPMLPRSGVTVPFRLHPERHRLQPPPSSVVVILAAGDSTYTAVHRRRSSIFGGWQPPLEQFAAWRYISSNADCFSESPQNFLFFPIIFYLTVFRF